MRKLVVFSLAALIALGALFVLTPARELLAQSLGIEVLAVVKPPCLNGKTILLVRTPARSVDEFLQESGGFIKAPILKSYHTDFIQFIGPEADKDAFIAELTRPHPCYKFGGLDTNGATIIK